MKQSRGTAGKTEKIHNTMSAGLSPINCDLRSYSRLWLGEFIELYQQEECLWHPEHPDYSNHSLRNKAYDRLVEKLKEVEPSPDRAMVVRKINSLRSAFRREFRKFNSKDNYETRLWYYNKLLFIAEQNPKRLAALRNAKTQKRSLAIPFDVEDSMEFQEEQSAEGDTVTPAESQPTEIKTVTVSSGECVIVKDEEQLQLQHQHPHHHQVTHQHQHPNELQQHQHNTEHLQHTTTTTQPQHATEVKVLEITSLDTNSQREIQQAVSSLEQHQQQMQHQLQQQHQHQQSQAVPPQIAQLHQQVPTIQIAREHLQPLFGNSYTTTATHRQDDEYDAIGINVASKLRVMNPTQRIIAEKLISDVLFNGQLDNLSVNSTLAQ